jgi:negative regulator of flagellin synthesis FlgM
MAINQINQSNNRILTDQTESSNRVGNNRIKKDDVVQNPSGTQSIGSDQVKLSPQAEIITRLTSQLADLSTIRADKVEALKAQIEAGTYKPSANDIADAIIRDEKI